MHPYGESKNSRSSIGAVKRFLNCNAQFSDPDTLGKHLSTGIAYIYDRLYILTNTITVMCHVSMEQLLKKNCVSSKVYMVYGVFCL